ncbi:lipid kinase, YegS/Rv2252/BmrU family [Cetobacterium ceti]|uniref:Lipid kinase, YegS/Rv2252/BmrU family n=1 Tax=Cetobacterium ceti TaxID=180163 RepID=A0A1T4JVA3_9FUSO|nr:YegS/Rv2252/BmrU family lipid kinase [Cetobacterium ceti]SJZ34064.1 lipid kinase, YegS/Rv2252/BmrU family [Cetobacterium ceti]
MKKVKFIYNPHSGEQIILKHLDKIIYLYQKQNLIIEPFRISFEFDLNTSLDGVNEKEYDHILISGGDGTINQVVNVLKKKNLDIPIAILPTGTANDFANLLGIPSNIEVAIKKILSNKPKKIDLGKANDLYFINIFSCGLFTEVSQKTPSVLKNTLGKLAYYFNGIKEIPHFKKIKLSIKTEDFSFQCSSLIFFVFNGKSAGNFNIAYKAKIDDGMLDVIIVKSESIASTLGAIFKFFKGDHLDHPEGIIHFQTKALTLKVEDDINTDIDGEPGPKYPINITCIKDGLSVLGI